MSISEMSNNRIRFCILFAAILCGTASARPQEENAQFQSLNNKPVIQALQPRAANSYSCNTIEYTCQSIGSLASPNGVTFIDGLTGWIVGDSGTIIHTTDGGVNWNPQSSGFSNNLADVKFFDARNGLITGNAGIILRTTDGGAAWNKQTSGTVLNLYSLSVLSHTVAIAAGDSGIILRSSDGGTTWSPVASGVFSALTSISFKDSLNGIIVGWNNTILRTTDAGLDWRTLSGPQLPASSILQCVSYGKPGRILFSARVKSDYGYEQLIAVSSPDDGSNWTQYLLWQDYHQCLYSAIALGANDTMYAAWNSEVYLSDDRGNTWTMVDEVPGVTFVAMSMVESRIFSVVGRPGIIFRVRDARWSPFTIGLISPEDNAGKVPLVHISYMRNECSFTWHQRTSQGPVDSNSNGYELQVSKDSTFPCQNAATTNLYTQDTTFAVSPIKFGETYYWRVFYGGTNFHCSWSPTYRFTTAAINGDQLPVLQSPINGSAAEKLDISLNCQNFLKLCWHTYPAYTNSDGTVEKPTTELQVSTDTAYSNGDAILHTHAANDTTPYFPGLQLNTKYYWRIRSRFYSGNSSWSNSWNFTTSDSMVQYPPFYRISPENGSSSDTVRVSRQNYVHSTNFKWQPYPDHMNEDGTISRPSYLLEYGTDSTTIANGNNNSWVCLSYGDSLGHTCYDVSPFRKNFWRMRAGYNWGGTYWSDVWSFSQNIPKATVQNIQSVDMNSLLLADSLQDKAPLSLQESPRKDTLYQIRVRCVIPPDIFTKGDSAIVVADPGHAGEKWHQMMVQLDPWDNGANDFTAMGLTYEDYQNTVASFMNIQTGDSLCITGFAVENNKLEPMSNTAFSCIRLEVFSSSTIKIDPYLLHVADFSKGNNIQFSTGEQYEGSLVEFHNVTVYSILNADAGTFSIIDGAGNIMAMSDLSCWFTLWSHRNPASTYLLPHAGTHINMIRGIIVTLQGEYRIAPLLPGDIDIDPGFQNVVSGYAYSDLNRDGIMNENESPLPGLSILLSGKIHSTAVSDSTGKFTFSGLDTGTYSLTTQYPEQPWYRVPNFSGPSTHTFTTRTGYYSVNIGYFQLWNHISGNVFNDLIENGIRDKGEPGIEHWQVKATGEQESVAFTDSLGNYSLDYVGKGINYLSLTVEPTWEQVYPRIWGQYVVIIDTLGKYYTNVNYAVHHIPVRIRLRLTVHDNIFSRLMEMYWGNRSGATYGIWGVDPGASAIDFSEQETELPPVSWAWKLGFFDARFQGPHNDSTRFGEGSWIDMRDFESPSQVDTHLVIFTPEYAEGGGYPMTIGWDKDSIAASYTGDVFLVDPYGTKYDMKVLDSIAISNNTIGSLLLIAHGPNLPQSSKPAWNLVSVPGVPLFPDPGMVFPMSQSSAFLYDHATGYNPAAAMQPGRGYWLKCLPGARLSANIGTVSLLPDTISITSGWNIIGAANVAVSTAAITTLPPAITGKFFAYNSGYQDADTLAPYIGYWVKASQSGSLILGAGTMNSTCKSSVHSLLDEAVTIVIHDADCRKQTLYIAPADTSGSSLNLSLFEMPPLPPENVGDIRFASNRYVEIVAAGKQADYPIQLSGNIAYPLTIECLFQSASPSLELSLKMGNKRIPLLNNSTITINGSNNQLVLHADGKQTTLLPKEYTLEQNYPNPFNPTTKIKYALPVASSVQLRIYNVIGQLVKTLVDGSQEAGYQEVEWTSTNAASGVYFFRLDAAGIGGLQKRFTQIRKMVLIR